MLINTDQFEKIKHKAKPSLQDVAVLIVTVDQLMKRNENQADELGKALREVHRLRRRLEWYQKTTVKDVSYGS